MNRNESRIERRPPSDYSAECDARTPFVEFRISSGHFRSSDRVLRFMGVRTADTNKMRFRPDVETTVANGGSRLNGFSQFVLGEDLKVGAIANDRAGTRILEKVNSVADGNGRTIDRSQLAPCTECFAGTGFQTSSEKPIPKIGARTRAGLQHAAHFLINRPATDASAESRG